VSLEFGIFLMAQVATLVLRNLIDWLGARLQAAGSVQGFL